MLGELKEILGVRGEPDFVEVCWHRNSMPQYHVGHCERVARIRELTGKFDGLELAEADTRELAFPTALPSGVIGCREHRSTACRLNKRQAELLHVRLQLLSTSKQPD